MSDRKVGQDTIATEEGSTMSVVPHRMRWMSLVLQGFSALCFALVSGCATTSPSSARAPQKSAPEANVSYREVPAAESSTYKLKPNQTSTAPRLISSELPSYPPELIALNLSERILSIQVIVDKYGDVSDVRLESAGDDYSPTFFASIQKAVKGWNFSPFTIATWYEPMGGGAGRFEEELVPFSKEYEFVFRIENGKPIVSSHALKSE